MKEVGHLLGSSEDAAKKRVSRAVEKMRAFLSRRGSAISAAALAGAMLANGAPAAPAGLSLSVLAAVTADGATNLTTLTLVKATMKSMLYAKFKAAAALTAALFVAAGAGTLVAQKTVEPKPPAKFDESTPLDALRNLADALERSDSQRVMASVDARTAGARDALIAMGQAVVAERAFKQAVTARFGDKPVRLVNINFGQQALQSGEGLENAVQYPAADRAVVRLPSKREPNKPHVIHMTRVKNIWKLSEEDTPGISDGAEKTAASY
jgi:hypothetical protein